MATQLPEPEVVEVDPQKILQECIAQVEEELGRPVQPSSIERIIIDVFVYREVLLRIQINDAAKQNLRRYARYPMIDLIAELTGVERIEPKFATTTERFTLPAARGVDSPIPAGTLIRSLDGQVTFQTDEYVEILTGQTTVDVGVTATVAGALANRYAPGQISKLVPDLGFAVAVTNLTETGGGAAQEDTEAFRERMGDAAHAFSVAGPGGAYKALARAASSDIADVRVSRPTPGTVEVVVLAHDGAPSGGLLTLVEDALNADLVRPLTDTVIVSGATAVDYAIEVELTLERGVNVPEVLALAEDALQTYVDDVKGHIRIAPDITEIGSAAVGRGVRLLARPEQLVKTFFGVRSVSITSPSPMPTVSAHQFARCTGITVNFAGYVPSEDD